MGKERGPQLFLEPEVVEWTPLLVDGDWSPGSPSKNRRLGNVWNIPMKWEMASNLHEVLLLSIADVLFHLLGSDEEKWMDPLVGLDILCDILEHNMSFPS